MIYLFRFLHLGLVGLSVTALAEEPFVEGLPFSSNQPDGRPLFWKPSPPQEPSSFNPSDPFTNFSRTDALSPREIPRSDDIANSEEPPGPALPLRAEVVIFHTSDPGPALYAWRTGPAGDAALFEALSRLEMEGKAERRVDTSYSTVGGRWLRNEAVREFIYPTESVPFADPLGVAPTAFETRNLGEAIGLAARARTGSVWRLDSRIVTTRCAGFSQWPLTRFTQPTNGPRAAMVRQPIIAYEKVATLAHARRGQPVLLGCASVASTPPPGQETGHAVNLPTPMQFTFLRVTPQNEHDASATAPPSESATVRLHLRIFRVPKHLAAVWLWERTGESDAVDLAHWEEATAEGTARDAGPIAVVAATGPVRPGGPPKAEIQAISEFIYPTQWEFSAKPERFWLMPTAYDTRNSGRSFSAQATWADDGRTVLAEVEDENIALLDLVSWPVSPDDPALAEDVPRFGQESYKGPLVLPEGGVRFIGARPVLPRGGDPEKALYAETDLLFLQAAAGDVSTRRTAPHAPAAPPATETQVFVFSLPPEKAAGFSGVTDDGMDDARAVDELWTLAETGEARVWLALATTGAAGGKSVIRSSFETTYPTELSPELLDRGLIGYTAFETFNHGTELKATVSADPAHPVQVTLQWESAASVHPAWADYERCLKAQSDEVPYPFFYMRKLGGTVPRNGSRVLGVLADPATASWPTASTGLAIAPAPVDSPEHGRTHVVVARCLTRPR